MSWLRKENTVVLLSVLIIKCCKTLFRTFRSYLTSNSLWYTASHANRPKFHECTLMAWEGAHHDSNSFFGRGPANLSFFYVTEFHRQ